jgi:transcriptional regulator with XRE-family HTH domain
VTVIPGAATIICRPLNLEPSEQYSNDAVRALAARRESLGLTRDALAKRAGLSRSMVSMMESGDRHPTLVTFHALCVALGTTPSELLGEIEQRD